MMYDDTIKEAKEIGWSFNGELFKNDKSGEFATIEAMKIFILKERDD